MPPFESTYPLTAQVGAGPRAGAPPVGHRAVAIVGNPNAGKSTLFNALTGANQPVGNWAGVTVDREVMLLSHRGVDMAVVDLPGVYSLAPSTKDEEVTRDHVLDGRVELFVNVLDASNLERNLYLTVQLLEMGVPMVVALNMIDTAREHGIEVDPRALSQQLGCPVVEVTAAKRHGIDALRSAMADALVAPRSTPGNAPAVRYAAEVEPALDELVELLRAARPDDHANARWIATRLLEGDAHAEQRAGGDLSARAEQLRDEVEATAQEDVDILIADGRYERIGEISAAALRRVDRLSATRSEKIDRIALHPTFGVPVFLGVMYVMFMLTINVGSAFIDLFDALGSAVFVQAPSALLESIGMPDVVVALVAGVGGGLQTVVTFVPPVGIMFLCLRFLEDSGYMARAAFVTDRLMRALGLPGKAFVPMIVGFGCNVPAIMGTRTLESERDRKLAVAMNPFMSCGARLPVYALFAAAFFPGSGQLVVFALYLIGIVFAVVTGLILKRTLLAGDLSPFIMELPPYHKPSMRVVVRGAWQRLRSFVLGAGKFIVPIVAVLTLLGSVGTDGSFGNDNTDKSVLSAIGRTITPIFHPMGIEDDNWPATVGIFTGVFAKEVVVGSLDSLYQQLGRDDAAAAGTPTAPAPPEEEPGVVETISDAFVALPGALVGSLRSATDPLGLSVGDVSDEGTAADEQGVDRGTFGAMAARFDGQIGAFAYLLFILLYLPCVAATAAIFRETGAAWATFVGLWTTGLAFGAATVCYQLGTFAEHPGSSAAWVVAVLVAFGAVVMWMGRNPGASHAPPAPPFCDVLTTVRASTPGSVVPAAVTGSVPIQVVEPPQTCPTAARFNTVREQPFTWQGPSVETPAPIAVDVPAVAVQPAPIAPLRIDRPTASTPPVRNSFLAPRTPFSAVRINSRPTPFAASGLQLQGAPDTSSEDV